MIHIILIIVPANVVLSMSNRNIVSIVIIKQKAMLAGAVTKQEVLLYRIVPFINKSRCDMFIIRPISSRVITNHINLVFKYLALIIIPTTVQIHIINKHIIFKSIFVSPSIQLIAALLFISCLLLLSYFIFCNHHFSVIVKFYQ